MEPTNCNEAAKEEEEEEKGGAGEVATSPQTGHALEHEWTFWYVYQISHHERKKKPGPERWKKDY